MSSFISNTIWTKKKLFIVGASSGIHVGYYIIVIKWTAKSQYTNFLLICTNKPKTCNVQLGFWLWLWERSIYIFSILQYIWKQEWGPQFIEQSLEEIDIQLVHSVDILACNAWDFYKVQKLPGQKCIVSTDNGKSLHGSIRKGL